VPLIPPGLTADTALLLDLDGTLLDFASTPDGVVVPPDLPGTLRQLRACFGDALAVITGRPIIDVDRLLGDIPYAVAGEHGGVIRHAPGNTPERAELADLPPEWLERAEQAIAAHPGALLERKSRSLVLHYRRAPGAEAALRAAVLDMLAGHEDRFALMESAMALEMKPLGADKGSAVASLMGRPPFAGRVPFFIGDDVTDEDGIRVALTLGGHGLRVQPWFTNAAGVRAWLAREAERLG
jgi:trehalose 6-phosphate phosphatase